MYISSYHRSINVKHKSPRKTTETYIKTEALPSRTAFRHHFGGSVRSRRRRLSLQRHRSVKSLLPTSGIVSATAVHPPRSSHACLPPASSLSFIPSTEPIRGSDSLFLFPHLSVADFSLSNHKKWFPARSLALLTFVFKDIETNVGSEKCHTSPPSLLFECKQTFRGVFYGFQSSLHCWRLTIQRSDVCISPHPVTNGTYSGQLSPCFPLIFMPPLSCHLQHTFVSTGQCKPIIIMESGKVL